MIKKFLFFISFFLLFSLKTYAASDLYVSLNGSSLTTQGYSYINPNTWSVFQLSGLYDNNHSYYRMSICFDGSVTQYSISSTNVSTISNIYVEKTSIPCTYYNSSYTGGTWTNVYFNALNVINSNNIATFSLLTTGGSVGLISASSSSEPFDYMIGQDNSTIIDQNQTIIEGNNSIKDEIGNLGDNINDNFNDLAEKQHEEQLVCKNYDKSNTITSGILANNGTVNPTDTAYGVTDFIKVDSNSKVKILEPYNTNSHICYYDSKKDYLSCIRIGDLAQNQVLTLPKNISYIRFTIRLSVNKPIVEICNNGNSSITNSLDDLNNNITNSDISGVEESFSRFEEFLDENSTITQLITLPVTLYSSILQGVSNSCSPFNLGNLYGENLILPCINIVNYLGSTLWGMIDLIISGFAVYSISKKLIKVFNNFSSMKDGDVIDD